ncbi:MAG: site-2 protease family protein [Phycisphaerales bacterium]|nr:site-2 protease family protein [Phycisphaerales bacterium]
MRPTFDNPMSWSLPLARVAGISVRIHAVFLVFIVVELLRSLYAAPAAEQPVPLGGPGPALILLLCMWWAVLLHEFGHCIVCRMTGGRADEILMWPLGGLATCEPPARWTAHLWTAIGGPLVNVILLAVLVPLLGGLTHRWFGIAIPSPLHLHGLVELNRTGASWWIIALFLFNWVNLVLLLFNLLPMYPLDGGRILQAALWPRIGYARSMRVAVRAGYIGAIALGILGLMVDETMLVLIAVFGGLTCWTTFRQLEWTEQVMGLPPGPEGEDEEPEEAPRPTREAVRAQAEADELDRILLKISASGLESLTPRERRLLNRATERRRRENG